MSGSWARAVFRDVECPGGFRREMVLLAMVELVKVVGGVGADVPLWRL